MTATERRHDYAPHAPCGWCGDPRDDHDRLAREWESCQTRATFFGPTAGLMPA